MSARGRSPQPVAAMAAMALSLALVACGFQLRGQEPLPGAMARTRLATPATARELRTELERLLLARGVVLVDGESADAATLTVVREQLSRVVQSVGASARVREFALVYRVTLRLEDPAGESLLPAKDIELRRDYVFDQNQILGTSSEEELIAAELRRNMALRILALLSAVRDAA